MNHIETAILNCYGIQEAEQNMVFAARLTQRGHTIRNMEDLMDLYHQTYSKETVEHIAGLPHPTVQKFMVITVAVVGASRRFLTQITRHQNEVKYMSASLQYSNYSGHAAFAIPYEILKAENSIQKLYTKSCQSDLNNYEDETRIVMLQIWEKLYRLSPILFAPDLTGPFCQRSSCMEKQMSCNRSIPKIWTPDKILQSDYPLLVQKKVNHHEN